MLTLTSRVPARYQSPFQWLPITASIFGALQIWFGLSGWLSEVSRPIGSLAGIEPIALPLAYAQIFAGLAIMQWRFASIRALAAALVAAAYVISLWGLFIPAAWEADFGGFPAMGGGQRIIKHLAIAALGLWITGVSLNAMRFASVMLGIARFGTVLVLLWIGTLKFVPYEANGIVRLIETSPFMSWMYSVMSVHQTATVIGVTEVCAGLLLLGWPYRRLGGFVGLLLAVGTFTATLTFLFTLPGWAPDAGAPWLSGSGAFFVKDQLLTLICVMCFCLEPYPAPPRIR